jgi:hypothetical protein
MSKNKVLKSFIGVGYYETLTPGVNPLNSYPLNPYPLNPHPLIHIPLTPIPYIIGDNV